MTDTRLDELPKEEDAGGASFAVPHVGPQQDLTFLDFLIIVAQRKKFVALVTVLGALAAILVALLLPVEYTATVTVLPPRGSAPLDSTPATQRAEADKKSTEETSKVAPASRDLNDLYVSILRSRAVEDAVVQHFGLTAAYRADSSEKARIALERHTTIDGATRDGLIRLNFSDRDPNRASEIANGYIEQFKTLVQHLVIPEAVRDGYFIQIVDPAAPPEQKSSPQRGRITIAGAAVGLTVGIMLALLQGGLVRMQHNPATRVKLELLKRSALRHSKAPADKQGVTGLRARHESTG